MPEIVRFSAVILNFVTVRLCGKSPCVTGNVCEEILTVKLRQRDRRSTVDNRTFQLQILCRYGRIGTVNGDGQLFLICCNVLLFRNQHPVLICLLQRFCLRKDSALIADELSGCKCAKCHKQQADSKHNL